jgi:hypothetical protein
MALVQSPNNGLVGLSAMASGRVPLQDAPSAVMNSPMGRRNASASAAVAQQRLLEHSQGVKLGHGNNITNNGQQQIQWEMHASKVAGGGGNKVAVNVQVDEREKSLSGLHRRSAAGPTALLKKFEAARASALNPLQVRQQVLTVTSSKQQMFEPNLDNGILAKKLAASRANAAAYQQQQSRQHAVPVLTSKQQPDGQMLHEQSVENVRIWQKHYRKAFPQMVFYFDGLPKEQAHKLSSYIRGLGAVCRLDSRLEACD